MASAVLGWLGGLVAWLIVLGALAVFFGAVAKGMSMTPSEYFSRNFWVGASFLRSSESSLRYDVGVDRIMWGPDFPHSSSAWPVDYELGREILERAGATESEIERIMWKNCADVFNIPYDDPTTISTAA